VGQTPNTERINRELIRLARRAESRPSPVLAETFVDVGMLFARLSTDDHQVIYGRRGTGKTHALYSLVDYASRRGHAAVFVDTRNLGSAGGIYNDPNRPLSERGTALLIDVLQAIHSGILQYTFESIPEGPQQGLLSSLDDFADSITQTRVIGEFERESAVRSKDVTTDAVEASLALSPKDLTLKIGANSTTQEEREKEVRERESGVTRPYVHFGAVSTTLSRVVKELPRHRLWIMLDEWSSLPLDLQPLLADLLRRSILPVQGTTVKIAAIEDRSSFQVRYGIAEYTGLELGADISADIDLDDFMSYARDPQRAKDFFGKMFHAHLHQVLPDDDLYGPPRELTISGGYKDRPKTVDQFLNRTFTFGAFAELVRTAEGIPRDAIGIAGAAALGAGDRPITERQVLVAAREWYTRDKERAIASHPYALELLHWLVDEVVVNRHSTAFFLRQDTDARHPLIRYLYDARLLHILGNDVAANDQRGIRFTLYRLDYGSYLQVEPIGTPTGTFRAITERGREWVRQVSPRYESIRDSVLELGSIPVIREIASR
jgi:hypothetical protein